LADSLMGANWPGSEKAVNSLRGDDLEFGTQYPISVRFCL